jgi:hypothetical protein
VVVCDIILFGKLEFDEGGSPYEKGIDYRVGVDLSVWIGRL